MQLLRVEKIISSYIGEYGGCILNRKEITIIDVILSFEVGIYADRCTYNQCKDIREIEKGSLALRKYYGDLQGVMTDYFTDTTVHKLLHIINLKKRELQV